MAEVATGLCFSELAIGTLLGITIMGKMEENSSKCCREVFDDMCNSTKRVKMFFHTMSTNNMASIIQILEEAVKKNEFNSTVKHSFEINYIDSQTEQDMCNTITLHLPLTPIYLGISKECWIKLHPIIENHFVVGYSFETTYFVGNCFSITWEKKKKQDKLLKDFINSMENNIYSNTSGISFLEKNGNDSLKWFELPKNIITLVKEKENIQKRCEEKKDKLTLYDNPNLRNRYDTTFEVTEYLKKKNINSDSISKIRKVRINKDHLLNITDSELLRMNIYDKDQRDNIIKATYDFLNTNQLLNENRAKILAEIEFIENELNEKIIEIENIKSRYEKSSRDIDFNQDNYNAVPGQMAKTAFCTALGACIGSVIPGVGTAIGACIGCAVGVLISLW